MVQAARLHSDQHDPASTPSVDEVNFHDLYSLEEIDVDTQDGWRLVLTRYRPKRQPFFQPLFGSPLLLVHGYTQNRRSWSSGQFVKTMLYFGADLFLLELRGHGKSSVDAQKKRAKIEKTPLPGDIDHGWDLDSYVLQDLPAAIGMIKRITGSEKVFYCGHSLGGILGYAYATLFDDLMGLMTIGSPSDFSQMPAWIRALGWLPPLAFPLVDMSFATANFTRVIARGVGRLSGLHRPEKKFEPLRFRRLPFRTVFRWLERRLSSSTVNALTGGIPLARPLLYQPNNVALSALRPLLREGSTDESRGTAEQLSRWVRRGRLATDSIRHDVGAALPRIKIPVAIFFGDEDPFATVHTTRNVYRSVSSDYLLWRPVRGNSHMELTMGYDIRQICYDVKNLMTYALDHAGTPHSSARPRRARAR